LHPLKGNLKGFWSLTVTGYCRLNFRYDEETNTASDIDMIDYHREAAMPMKNPPHPGDLIRTEIPASQHGPMLGNFGAKAGLVPGSRRR
jgi:hypothetical protein